MCYRLEQTAHSDPDPLIASARIGLLSNVELWLGIIVACLPTMAPFFRIHLLPSLSKLSRKLYGSSGPSSKEETPRVQLRTFGGSGPPGSKVNKNYTELSGISISADEDYDKLHLVPSIGPKVYTDCKSSNTEVARSSDGIHVQKKFQILDV
jgi:hypothetical protein